MYSNDLIVPKTLGVVSFKEITIYSECSMLFSNCHAERRNDAHRAHVI